VLSALTSYVTGFVITEIRGPVREAFGTAEAEARLAEFPYLSASRGYLGGPGRHSEAAFEAGLDLLCLGAAAVLSGRQHRAEDS